MVKGERAQNSVQIAVSQTLDNTPTRKLQHWVSDEHLVVAQESQNYGVTVW